MTRIFRLALASLVMTTAPAFASPASREPPQAPAEVTAAAPAGTTLLSFATSGARSNPDAVAVFETAPDKDSVRHRTLVVFGERGGKFVPDFSSDKLIACSKCSQFHDDQFYPSHVKISPGHIRIEQFDAGEKPSQTVLDLVRKSDGWHVASATRETFVAGEGEGRNEKLKLPPSGMARDLDPKWNVPVFLNTILINHRKGNSFSFVHGNPSVDAMWKSQAGDCNPQDCTILVQAQDGCISLARDASSHPFGAATPDPKDEDAATAKALSACNAAGGKSCATVRTDCSTGIR